MDQLRRMLCMSSWRGVHWMSWSVSEGNLRGSVLQSRKCRTSSFVHRARLGFVAVLVCAWMGGPVVALEEGPSSKGVTVTSGDPTIDGAIYPTPRSTKLGKKAWKVAAPVVVSSGEVDGRVLKALAPSLIDKKHTQCLAQFAQHNKQPVVLVAFQLVGKHIPKGCFYGLSDPFL